MHFTFCVNKVNNSDILVNYKDFNKSFRGIWRILLKLPSIEMYALSVFYILIVIFSVYRIKYYI